MSGRDTRLVLASGSPRRSELLARAGFSFSVAPSSFDESPLKSAGLPPEDLVRALARGKALEVSHMLSVDPAAPDVAGMAVGSAAGAPCPLVVGADTVVVLGDEVLGKPRDAQDARRMLGELSGSDHRVLTGVCLARGGEEVEGFCETTIVSFYELTDAQVDAYVETGEPMDKAGAYAIQGAGCLLVRGIKGDYFNVVGLPVARLARRLEALGVMPCRVSNRRPRPKRG